MPAPAIQNTKTTHLLLLLLFHLLFADYNFRSLNSTFYEKCFELHSHFSYTLFEAWSGVNWADLMAAQGPFGTDFYDRSTRTIVGTMLWTEYRPVIKVGPPNSLRSKPRTEYRTLGYFF